MRRRNILVAGAATFLLGLPLSGVASADSGAWSDPIDDCCPGYGTDIVQHSLALNSQVVSSTAYVSAYDRALLQSAAIRANLDVTGDGATDYVLDKAAGGESASLRSGEYGPVVPNCPVAFSIEPYVAGIQGTTATAVTLSTSAACIGSPVSARVKNYVSAESGFDYAPGMKLFSPAVSRGYTVIGAIADRYNALGGARGYLGMPLTDEADSARGGRYNLFQGGAIYWTEATGAHAVRGAIRDRWSKVGAEWSVLGYPKTDEVRTGGRPGAVNLFEGGSVYWSAATGAHEMYGAILGAWGSQGYEGGRLGFPTTGEFDSPDGRKQEFQGGNIVWTPQRGAVIAYR
ncbi:LGFP repeat-containing protein [Modestobacter sp. VKM Ac-2984]|uniref:LGFP repeat-containing protein n=1 Tax=Modestobacter sp. VKM Ac-2984 TaxID=3004138 RepID=UPI0022AB4CA1|nr:hypothetical protein [Modestobacter sp. VKM Ac-2984]MCZ2817078.1 hypothetical protein [Modestobacter sp. VKM Ac-2984]